MIALSKLARPNLRAWLASGKLERRLALALTVCAIVAGLTTYAVIAWSPLGDPEIRTVLVLLNIDLVLLLLLGIVVARRLVRLVAQRRQGRAGSRLHVRLVVLFGLLAATPAIVVAVFSVVFLGSGLEYWFSERVSSALENSLNVAEAYLEEHKEVIRADALAMAADLEREGTALDDNPDYLRHLVVAQAALRSLTEAIVFDGRGRMLAHSGLGIALEIDELSQDTLQRAARGEVVTMTSAAEDRVRALLRLDGPAPRFLFVGRFVDPQVLGFMDRTQRIVADYRQLAAKRSGIQITSSLIFMIVALLLLLAAIWVGTNLADRLALPIVRLIDASDRVARGDLAARVPETAGVEELGKLSRAFNHMTDQLDSQRQELVATNRQLDDRRRFTEAVLEGVSAGIIGLDAERRVVLPNPQAAELLAPGPAGLIGQPLDAIFPEILPLMEQLGAGSGDTAYGEVALHRGDTKRLLLVRVARQAEHGRTLGHVVTFDDVTALVSAQREAAWSEVARRIAHEIKNPLTPIRLSAERLSRRFAQQIGAEDRESFIRSVTTIIRQVDAIGRLVSEFSAFARMPQPTIRFEALGDLLRQAVSLQQAAWPQVTFETSLPADDPLVIPCDAEKLAQVCNNLLQNAANALIERGRRGEGDRGEARRGGVIEVSARRAPGAVVVEIADDGPGFPAEARDRLLEPYFTTRAQGTGLGLAIVKKIMEEHLGRVELADRPQGGALVRLTFPVGGVELPATEAPASGVAGRRGAERPSMGAR